MCTPKTVSYAELSSPIHVVRDALKIAAKKYNVKYSALSKIADLESAFRSDATNRYSSAKGLFQIIRSTERDLRKRCGTVGDIFDSYVNADLGACLLRINTIYLQRNLGRTPYDWERYILHFMGLNNGHKFIKTDDSIIAEKKFPRAAKSNRYIFYKKGVPRTIGEIKELFKLKMEKGRVL